MALQNPVDIILLQSCLIAIADYPPMTVDLRLRLNSIGETFTTNPSESIALLIAIFAQPPLRDYYVEARMAISGRLTIERVVSIAVTVAASKLTAKSIRVQK